MPGLPQPGSTVGSYVIERVAGVGGMSVVFEARHSGLDKRVALKMLLPNHAAESETARRFAREGAAAAGINHPHAVDVTDVGRDENGAPFLVMEFLEGEDLASLLERAKRLGVQQTVDLLVPVISALAAAHDLGIVHRDLKPQNIMLSQRRHELVPKVVDFGISKKLEQTTQLTGTQALLGTPKYMSPEQASGAGKVDARSDQFALGTVLYECLVGQCPFEAANVYAVLVRVVEATYTKPRVLVPELPRELEAIVVRALRREAKDRFPNIRQLGAALLPFASARIQLSFAADFSGPAVLPRGGAPSFRPLRESEESGTRRSLGSAAAAPLAMTAAQKWLTAGGSRRAWGVGLGSILLAGLGVAAPVALIAMRNHESMPGVAGPSATSVEADVVPNLPGMGPVATVTPTPAPPGPAPRPDSTQATFQIDLSVEPNTAWLALDRKAAGVGRLRRTFPVDGVTHELLVGARGYRMRTLHFKDAPPPERLQLEKLPASETNSHEEGANGAPILR